MVKQVSGGVIHPGAEWFVHAHTGQNRCSRPPVRCSQGFEVRAADQEAEIWVHYKPAMDLGFVWCKIEADNQKFVPTARAVGRGRDRGAEERAHGHCDARHLRVGTTGRRKSGQAIYRWTALKSREETEKSSNGAEQQGQQRAREEQGEEEENSKQPSRDRRKEKQQEQQIFRAPPEAAAPSRFFVQEQEEETQLLEC